MTKDLFCDYEFCEVVEKNVKLVCAATFDPQTNTRRKFWLHKNPKTQQKLAGYLKGFDRIIGYSCVAEARSFLALGLGPLEFKWIDIFLEYRMLTNHNDELQWGKQLVNGKVKTVRKPKPKWQRDEDDDATGFKATHSLAEATYKLTGEIRDTKHKNQMRDLIISNPDKFTDKERHAIMDYCMEDVDFLPRMWAETKKKFFETLPPRKGKEKEDLAQYLSEAELRGRYSAHTAIMESLGYPIDVKKTKNFSKQVPNILYDLQREINRLFPEIKPFKWNKKEQRFSWDQTRTKEWITDNHDVSRWKKTDKGQVSLSLEAFERFYAFKHDYPTDNFGAQMVRYAKTKQSLYGFVVSPNSDKKNFWDHVGSDGRVRPYMNIYGAQSSRSQPGATGFMFLKPAWMRALVVPPKGMFMAGIDYGSQEFFVSAIKARDKNMIEAYLSGDPYLYQGKLSGSIPKDGTKESHKALRDMFKATTLGISYLMTKFGLAIKLTNDTGKEWTEDDAQDQIDLFYDNFSDLKEYQEEIQDQYLDEGNIRLECGWYMWGDNDNLRSVGNVPIQGFGASVMRKAVDLAVARGVEVLFTLHDALYIQGKVGEEWKIVVLRDCMREAFVFYIEEEYKEIAAKIKLDPFAWSPNYKPEQTLNIKDGKGLYRVEASNLYLDQRATRDYEKFSQYFHDRLEDDL